MEIQDSSLPGFYCSRILGLAPYLFRRNNKDRIDDIRRSTWLCAYSICFMIASGKNAQTFNSYKLLISLFFFDISVTLTIRFIFVDSNSKTPIRWERLIFINRPEVKIIISIFLIRMRTATSKFVTVFDVCVVVGACLCGAVTGIAGRKFIQKINSNLTKVCHHVNSGFSQPKIFRLTLFNISGWRWTGNI